MILRKRAEEILSLVKRTENEITLSDQSIAGDVYIGAVESDGIRLLTRVAQKVQSEYPHIHFHISRGNGKDVLESLDKAFCRPWIFPNMRYLKSQVKSIGGY